MQPVEVKSTVPDLDFTSSEWATLREEFKKLLEAETNSLCSEEDPIKAAKLRGSIGILKRVLKWEERKADERHRHTK